MPGTRIIDTPPDAQLRATLLLAHGAGAPMDSAFMQLLVTALNGQGVAVVRFEFAYMRQRRISGKRAPPGSMDLLLEKFREHWAETVSQYRGPLLIGGKSMGGRVASMLADELGAAGLCCFGYPFHPPGKPEKTRTAHLESLRTQTLILQGTRDPFGRPADVAGYDLSTAIEVHWLETADHDFQPLKRSGNDQAAMIGEAAVAVGRFCEQRLR
ncbi:alpha/beta family hydrolase [Halopseudomonas sp.]|uniref:alpha/beta family hydrolase n=1 Tax=Halopseudomonas sp. TaxID=2901191 RepID=UPI00356294AF